MYHLKKKIPDPLTAMLSLLIYSSVDAWFPYAVIAVQSPSHVQLLATPWTAARQAALCLTISQSLPKFMSIASLMPPSHLILWCPLLCPQSSPASGILPMNRLFTSNDQNTGASASASVLPEIFQGWSPLKLTGLISLLSKGLSEVFTTTVWRHKFFGVPPSLLSSSLNHMWPVGLDYTDLCQQE